MYCVPRILSDAAMADTPRGVAYRSALLNGNPFAANDELILGQAV